MYIHISRFHSQRFCFRKWNQLKEAKNVGILIRLEKVIVLEVIENKIWLTIITSISRKKAEDPDRKEVNIIQLLSNI